MPSARFSPRAQMVASGDRRELRRIPVTLARFQARDDRNGIGVVEQQEGIALIYSSWARGLTTRCGDERNLPLIQRAIRSPGG